MAERELGIITGTMLGIEDHGILSSFVFFDFGGTSQGFGGYALDGYDEKEKERFGTDCGMDFILRTLRAVGVSNWEDLKGKEMWVEREDGWNSNIIAIEAPKYRKNGGRFDVRDWKKKWLIGTESKSTEIN